MVLSSTSEPRYAKLQKSRVACERCRSLKVRCDLTDAGNSQSCFRCQKSNLQCIPDRNPAPKRKKPLRVVTEDTDHRIEQLEAALIETRNAVRSIQPKQPVQDLARQQFELPQLFLQAHESAMKRNHLTPPIFPKEPSSLPRPPLSTHSSLEPKNHFEALLASGKLGLTQAKEYFQHFMNVLLPACPHVHVEDTPFEQMRMENPLKLHAIIIGVLNTTVCSEDVSLDEGLRAHFAERLHVALGTDTGLIESIMIMLCWSTLTDDSKRLSYSLMLASIAHSLCVVDASRDGLSPTLHMNRLYLSVYIGLGGMCASLKVVPMVRWCAAWQDAYDELLRTSDNRDDYRITVSANVVRLEQEMSTTFDVTGQTLEAHRVEALIAGFDARIEELREDLFTTTLHVFGFYSLKFTLYDRASRYLPRTNASYSNCIREAVSAVQSTVEYFVSNKHLLDTFPPYIQAKPIRAVMSMFKICACAEIPSYINVNPQKYMYDVLECFSTAKQTASVVRIQRDMSSMVDRFCRNDFSEESTLSKLWKREIMDTVSHQKREENWDDFMKSFNIQQTEVDFWNQLGL